MTSPCPDLIPDALWEAYAETVYVFRDEDSVGLLRAGALPDRTTEDVLKREEEACGAVVSAAFPQHGPLAGHEGDSAALRERLRADGYRYYAGAGIGMSPGDDAEPCFFVPGMAEADAIALGRAFGQNVVLVVERGRPARLVAAR
ncbi:MAG TPA: DUF3293 domain-containing protein [Moraxellaceae bacterium]|nr:DUF3293 domain-containing protein [Moraxellaceae bacterium]